MSLNHCLVADVSCLLLNVYIRLFMCQHAHCADVGVFLSGAMMNSGCIPPTERRKNN